MAKWKDRKRHYNDEEPSESSIRLGSLRLSIHRHIDHPPDQWLASCSMFFSQRELKSKKMDEAKCQAKAILQVILEDAIADILDVENKN